MIIFHFIIRGIYVRIFNLRCIYTKVYNLKR